MSTSFITVDMLLHSIDLEANSSYVKIRSDAGWYLYPKHSNVALWFADTRLLISLTELNATDLPTTSDMSIVLGIINESKISIPKLTGIIFAMGVQNVISNYSFAWHSYLYREWDEVDKVMDYSIHVKKNESEHVICLPDRYVKADSKQFERYVSELNKHVQSIYLFNNMYNEIPNWWDVDEYEDNEYDYNLTAMYDYIKRQFVRYPITYTSNDTVDTLQLHTLQYTVSLEDYCEKLTVNGLFALRDVDDTPKLKELSKPSILLFMYVRYMITKKR